MLPKSDRADLLSLSQQFINCGEEITLAHLLDAVSAKITDKESSEWKQWSQYMEILNETWCRIYKENEDIPWPEPPLDTADDLATRSTVTSIPIPSPQVLAIGNADSGTAYREQLRRERKLQLEGGNGVGPARTPKQVDRSKGGRKRDELADDLVLQFNEPKPNESNKFRVVVYCIACDQRSVGRDTIRIRDHASECNDLAVMFPVLFQRVKKDLAERSHSKKLGKSPQENGQITKSSTSEATLHTYMNSANITEKQKMNIEWYMFRMFICCALPWAMVDNTFFKEFVAALSPNFNVPDRSAFFAKHIPQEIAHWGESFKEFLQNKYHLTMSFDGWSSRAKDEIYTFNTTTPKRRSFFTDGHIFRGESVTGDALKEILIRLITTYNAAQYSAVVGDGGPNVRSAKKKLVQHFAWILNIYDPCHNLSLYMKDIGKLFKDMLVIVSGIANYFGKSNYGTYHLDEQRKRDGIKEGIKSHSETRFSSSYYQVVSVNSCMDSIKKCIKSQTLKFDTGPTKRLLLYMKDGSTAHYQFMSRMSGFIQLLSSGANGLLTLEGQNTTCADVFYVWVCIAYHLEQVLASDVAGLTHLRADIIKIYNHRFSQMMTESSHEIFLLACYLHPLFRHNGGLQLTMPVLPEGAKLQPNQYPELFRQLLTSTLKIFQGEQIRLQDSGIEVVPRLIDEFIRYAYNKEPFNNYLWTRETKPLRWWDKLARDSNAGLLSRVAIKIFSISPSEICDERTASRLGWFNAARRSSITPEHLVNSAKLYDFYVNGFNDGGYAHTARVHLSAVNKSGSSPALHSAPSLMDLLNVDNLEPKDLDITVMEEQLFNHPDPYDLAETDRVDPALQDFTIRSSVRFDIGEFVKLNDTKLIKLITNVDLDGPGADSTSNTTSETPKPVGEPGKWNIDSFI